MEPTAPVRTPEVDQIERGLVDIRDQLTAAWRTHQDSVCPVGHLAALAAALVTFYQEMKRQEARHGRP